MDKLKTLEQKLTVLMEEQESLLVTKDKKQQAIDMITAQITEIKNMRDAESFKFVLSHIPEILEKITPKHKIPPDRVIDLTNSPDMSSNGIVSGDNPTHTAIRANVPWTNDKECSDDDPFNVSICPRCAILHFRKFADHFLANYFVMEK